VYEAEDGDLGRRVALKVYHQPERDRSQLAHEARVAVSLAGPGVVRVFDVDVDAGWLAMQWAPLGALGVLLRSGEGRLLGVMGVWASCLARALARVHAAGWVHHDIKPANVLVEAPGRVILTDFAAARRRGEAGPPGSRGYVSPERAAGRASDPRDDVFGYGRTVEDVLAALDRARAVPAPGVVSAWRELALACTGPDAQRPVDGAALVERIDAIAAR
jgi:serine/threonine-protein kinase